MNRHTPTLTAGYLPRMGELSPDPRSSTASPPTATLAFIAVRADPADAELGGFRAAHARHQAFGSLVV
ncbi:hypothetical protein [Mycobacterium sp. BK086]|uniref:hypothetical protein n=1 Tax=Mycobacterium sp. BK086 TaxID=2512165 RepID=UPI00105CA8C1|nr:hypothetical protein [Mycobacterium sp. BK086]